MHSPIRGLHHVTATVDDAQADLDFAAGRLGLRLVKKTVNFDNPFVYHFYYGDETGTPGTIWTTFPYRSRGVRPGRIGPGQVTAIAFSVPESSLAFWRDRLEAAGAGVESLDSRFGDPVLRAHDPSGIAIELIATAHDGRAPWTGGGIGHDRAVRGVHSVTLASRAMADTLAFMTGLLGFEVAATERGRSRLVVGGPGPGHAFDVVDGFGSQPGVNGLGTVHHVAVAVATADEHLTMRDRLVAAGVIVTPVQDRQYFQSIYFREPGGVLFEIATSSPGFAADETVPDLGQALKLPPWEEANRPTIEASLDRVIAPRSPRS